MKTYTVITSDPFSGERQVHTVKAHRFYCAYHDAWVFVDDDSFDESTGYIDSQVAMFTGVVRIQEQPELEVA